MARGSNNDFMDYYGGSGPSGGPGGTAGSVGQGGLGGSAGSGGRSAGSGGRSSNNDGGYFSQGGPAGNSAGMGGLGGGGFNDSDFAGSGTSFADSGSTYGDINAGGVSIGSGGGGSVDFTGGDTNDYFGGGGPGQGAVGMGGLGGQVADRSPSGLAAAVGGGLSTDKSRGYAELANTALAANIGSLSGRGARDIGAQRSAFDEQQAMRDFARSLGATGQLDRDLENEVSWGRMSLDQAVSLNATRQAMQERQARDRAAEADTRQRTIDAYREAAESGYPKSRGNIPTVRVASPPNRARFIDDERFGTEVTPTNPVDTLDRARFGDPAIDPTLAARPTGRAGVPVNSTRTTSVRDFNPPVDLNDRWSATEGAVRNVSSTRAAPRQTAGLLAATLTQDIPTLSPTITGENYQLEGPQEPATEVANPVDTFEQDYLAPAEPTAAPDPVVAEEAEVAPEVEETVVDIVPDDIPVPEKEPDSTIRTVDVPDALPEEDQWSGLRDATRKGNPIVAGLIDAAVSFIPGVGMVNLGAKMATGETIGSYIARNGIKTDITFPNTNEPGISDEVPWLYRSENSADEDADGEADEGEGGGDNPDDPEWFENAFLATQKFPTPTIRWG